MNKRKIARELLLTPQEHKFIGSTLFSEPTQEKQWYIPEGVLRRKISIREAIEGRKRIGFLKNSIISVLVGISEPLVMELEDLNLETGETVRDPIILGIWDEKKGEIKKLEGRDLTREIYQAVQDRGYNYHLRELPTKREGEGTSGPEVW